MKSLNTGEKFEQFWEETVKKANNNKVDEPKLLTKVKSYQHLQTLLFKTNANSPSTPKKHYKAIYFKGFNTAIDCLEERFKNSRK